MSQEFALTGAAIFDGETTHNHHSLLVAGGVIAGICSNDSIPDGMEHVVLQGGLLAPGFVDLQVNGGGGILFNEHPTLQGIETICNAHHQLGTTGLLVTLITDTPEITECAIQAGIKATQSKLPGFLGLHLEGPHLATSRKGAHDPKLIRTMEERDCQQLIAARSRLPNLMVTVAPEAVSNSQISQMTKAGIIVSLGHSDASFQQVQSARNAGASCITHLYNAMSPLSHREPGVVGAGLSSLGFHCGLIADGYHVDPTVISFSLAAKQDTANIFLVSDSMSTVGTDLRSFELNGRTIYRDDGCLRLDDGTLAGADLDLNSSLRYMVETVGVAVEEAIRMASIYPLRCLDNASNLGGLILGQRANIIHLDDRLSVTQTWVDGSMKVRLESNYS